MMQSLIRHSILSAMSLDAVGLALNCLPEQERADWYASGRDYFPEHGGEESFGEVSVNSKLMLTVLSTLVKSDALPTITEVSSMSGLVVGVSVGYYGALAGKTTLESLAYISEAHFTDHQEYCAARLVCFLVCSLLYTGYFGYETLEEAHRHRLLAELTPFAWYMLDTHPELDRLRHFSPKWLKGCNYSFRLLAYVVFYMLRVDTASLDKDMLALPREQLIEVFSIDGITEYDAGFIFGAICTASEHKHPLVPKSLRESVQLRESVDITLNAYKV